VLRDEPSSWVGAIAGRNPLGPAPLGSGGDRYLMSPAHSGQQDRVGPTRLHHRQELAHPCPHPGLTRISRGSFIDELKNPFTWTPSVARVELDRRRRLVSVDPSRQPSGSVPSAVAEQAAFISPIATRTSPSHGPSAHAGQVPNRQLLGAPSSAR
jgi:hypothetical protein